MIITKEGDIKLEKGEYRITDNPVKHTLVCYWTLTKRYTEDDLSEAGFPWRCAIEQVDDPGAPRDFFNYVYISEVVRTRIGYWFGIADGQLEDWVKAGKTKKDLKIYKMYQFLSIHGWSPDPEKSRRGALGNAAKALRCSRQTVKNLIAKYPDPPEPPFEQRFARIILDYYNAQKNRFGEHWFWKATALLPSQYELEGTTVWFEVFRKHNEGRSTLDFSILDGMYNEFSKLKLLYNTGFYGLYVTKGDVKLIDLREPRKD